MLLPCSKHALACSRRLESRLSGLVCSLENLIGRAPPPQLQLQHWRSVASTKSEQQLVRKWFDFAADPCGYFDEGKMKACTLSLTVLVAIEMFNALNALSETRLA